MRLRICLAGLLGSMLAFGQEAGTLRKVADYPVHRLLADLALGAEYLGKTVPNGAESFMVPGYLVVEVAVEPRAGAEPVVNDGQFSLIINGKKTALLPQPPPFVAASLKYPDWESHPNLTVGGGVGNAGVILGRQPTASRFPDDRRPSEQQPVPPGQPPRQEGGEGLKPKKGGDAEKPEERVISAALPEGPVKGPVAGLLYFPYSKKLHTAKSLELRYRSEGQEVSLPLSGGSSGR